MKDTWRFWLVIASVALALCAIGYIAATAQEILADDCEALGKFRVRDVVYVCYRADHE